MDKPATLAIAAAEAIAEIRRREAEQARLTAINAELVEALSLAVAYLSEIPHDPALKIAAALARAKEASHDAD